MGSIIFIKGAVGVNKSNYKKYIIIGIIVVLIAVVALVMVFRFKDKKDDSSEDKTNRVPAEYDALIDTQIDAINENNPDYWIYSEYASIKQDMDFQKYYSEIAGYEETYAKFFKDYFEEINEYMGGEYTITYSIEEERKFDDKELEIVKEYFATEVEAMYAALEDNKASIKEELSDIDVSDEDINTCLTMYETAILGYQNMDISEVNKLNIKVSIESEKNKDSFVVEILVAKIDGLWVFMQENEYLNNKHYVFSSGITPYTVCTNICE